MKIFAIIFLAAVVVLTAQMAFGNPFYKVQRTPRDVVLG